MINISGVRGGHYALECPNKRIIVMRYNGDVGSENDKIRLWWHVTIEGLY